MKLKFIFLFLIALSIITIFKPVTAFASDEIGWNQTGDIIKIWNTQNDYYINITSGLQVSNVPEEWWSNNYLCATINLTGNWQYFCTDDLPFNWTIISDNETYVNVTSSRLQGIALASINLSFTWSLGINDTNITIIPRITNTGTLPINRPFAFAWKMKDIQLGANKTGNQLLLFQNHTRHYYNITTGLNISMTNNVTWGTFAFSRQAYENQTFPIQSMYLYFDVSQNETITANSTEVTLIIPIGTLAGGQSKSITLAWVDDVILSCSLGYSVQAITFNFKDTDNTTTITSVTTENQTFTFQGSFVGTCVLEECENTCTSAFRASYSSTIDLANIGEDYTESSGKSFVKVVRWNGYSQNQKATGDGFKYNISVICGFRHSSGTSATRLNASFDVGGVQKRDIKRMPCMDVKAPFLRTTSLLNMTVFEVETDSKNVSIQLNFTDDTKILGMEFWENWTNGDGSLNMAWDKSFTTSQYPTYNYTANLSFILPRGNYSYTTYIGDTASLEAYNETFIFTLQNLPPRCSYMSPTDANNSVITDRNFTIVNVTCDSSVTNMLLNWNWTVNYTLTQINTTTWQINHSDVNGTYVYRIFINDTLNMTNSTDNRAITFDFLYIIITPAGISALLLIVVSLMLALLSFAYNITQKGAILIITSAGFIYIGIAILLQGIDCSTHFLCFADRHLINSYSMEAFLLFISLTFGSIINLIHFAFKDKN